MERLDIGRRESQVASASIASNDLAVDLVMPAEERLDGIEISASHRITDAGRTDDLTLIVAHRLDDHRVDLALTAELFEHLGISRAVFAEDKSISNQYARRADARVQDFIDELLGCALAHLFVEGQRNHTFEATRLEQLEFLLGCREPEIGYVRTKESHRVRLEGQHRRIDPEFSRPIDHLSEHSSMSEMNAVEISDGDDRRRQAISYFFDRAKYSHGSARKEKR